MARKKGFIEEVVEEIVEESVNEAVEETVSETIQEKTEKEVLLDLYKELKDRGISSIGDLENLIARK